MKKLIDLAGRQFGRLTVIERSDDYISPKGQHKPRWKCLCECGTEIIADGCHLRNGAIVSCGCYNQKLKSERGTHHQAHSRLYNIWCNMKSRCYYKGNTRYLSYGGRGITVCGEWVHNFQAFYDWAVLAGYDDGLSTDRINVDGNYCPENCRWATSQEQSENRRDNVLCTINGEVRPISFWCRKYGQNESAVRWRVRNGWPIEKALGLAA